MSNTTYDMAIIGSGLGGLVCNYILAKHGFKTILLEKQPQVGGCLQTFRRFGVKYETGMHYIGSMDEGKILHRLFTYLDLIHKVKISKLDETGFDIFSIGGKIYKYASGVEQFVETLGASFPQNKVDIANYIQQIHTIAQRSTLYHFN